MEGENLCSNSPSSGSRWNPTKEQINMLEGLYMKGLRTPSAEQIQQITEKLRVYGHIEGKNVFYWFQNHKARQRQKQKQENIAYLNRFLHTTPVIPTYQNGIVYLFIFTPFFNAFFGVILSRFCVVRNLFDQRIINSC